MCSSSAQRLIDNIFSTDPLSSVGPQRCYQGSIDKQFMCISYDGEIPFGHRSQFGAPITVHAIIHAPTRLDAVQVILKEENFYLFKDFLFFFQDQNTQNDLDMFQGSLHTNIIHFNGPSNQIQNFIDYHARKAHKIYVKDPQTFLKDIDENRRKRHMFAVDLIEETGWAECFEPNIDKDHVRNLSYSQ